MQMSLTKLFRELVMCLVVAVEKHICGDCADNLHGLANAHFIHQEKCLLPNSMSTAVSWDSHTKV